MSKVLGTVTSTSSATATGTYGTIGTGGDESKITATTELGSVVLLVFQMILDDPDVDQTAKFRFTVDGGTGDNPSELACFSDSDFDRAGSTRLIWAVDGLTAASHVFRVEWELIQSTPSTNTARQRSFQVIELTDATLKVDISDTDVVADPATWGDLHSSTFEVASSSLHLLIFNSSAGDTAESCSEYRFAIADTLDGPITSTDCNDPLENDSTGMIWAETGLTGSKKFAIQWQERLSPGETAALRRTFQVIEISDNFNLHTDVKITSSQLAPGTEAKMTGMEGTITPESIDSVVMVISCGTILDEQGGEAEPTCSHRLYRGSTAEGGHVASWSDKPERVTPWCLVFAKDQITAESVWEHRWILSRETPETDTTRERTFQIIDFKKAAAATRGGAKRHFLAVPGMRLSRPTFGGVR